MFKQSLKPIFHHIISVDRGSIWGCRHSHTPPCLPFALLKSVVPLYNIHLSRVPVICKGFLFPSLWTCLNSLPFPPHILILFRDSLPCICRMAVSGFPPPLPCSQHISAGRIPTVVVEWAICGSRQAALPEISVTFLLFSLPRGWLSEARMRRRDETHLSCKNCQSPGPTAVCSSISPLGVASTWSLEALCLEHEHQLMMVCCAGPQPTSSPTGLYVRIYRKSF